MAREHYRWRVPGNSNPFDKKLEDWEDGQVSQRSIGILEYLEEEEKVEITKYEDEIRDFLEINYDHERNKSSIGDWYRPLVFMGLVDFNDDCLSLSDGGKRFLKEIHEENYEKALNYYLKLMLRSTYPNPVAKDIYLSLFPFRIIFKMLLEKPIPKRWFITKIPYIKNYDDLENLDNINGAPYDKWLQWIFPFLKKWEIIKVERDYVRLLEHKKEFFESALGNMNYETMFFEDEKELDILVNLIDFEE